MLIYMMVLFALPFVPAFDRAEAQPSWTSRRPREKGYWTGIGSARIDGDVEQVRARARAAALRDIATQIATNLHGNSRFVQTEDARGLDHNYRDEIRTEVEVELEYIELVDTWNDGENFWAYARLSIAEYQQRQRVQIDAVRQHSAALCRQATALEDGDIATALSLYIRALDHVQHPRFAELESLQSEIAARIQRLLAEIQLSTVPVASAIKRGADTRIDLVVKAQRKDGRQRGIKGLPLDLRFILGAGQLDERVWTGEGGAATARLYRVDGKEQTQRIVARLDLSAFAVDGHSPPFNAPFAVFELAVEKRRILIQCNGEEELVTPLRSMLIASLSRLGLDRVEHADAADLILHVQVSRRPEQMLNELHFAQLDIEIELRNTREDARIYHRISGVKGAGNNRAQATARACKKAGQQLERHALPEALAALNR